jgi:hypothetical protein
MVLGQFVQQHGQQVVETRNAVNELDVDIVIDEGMDTPTVQAEQFDTLVKMLPALGPLGQSPQILKTIIQASQLRDKDKLLEMLEPKDGQGPPSQEELMQAQAQQIQQQTEAEGQIEVNKATIKAKTDIEVAKIKSATDAHIAEEKLKVEAHVRTRQQILDAEAKKEAEDATGVTAEKADTKQFNESQMAIMQQLADTLAAMNRPKTKIPVRDENGFIVGIREEAA